MQVRLAVLEAQQTGQKDRTLAEEEFMQRLSAIDEQQKAMQSDATVVPEALVVATQQRLAAVEKQLEQYQNELDEAKGVIAAVSAVSSTDGKAVAENVRHCARSCACECV